MTPPGPALASLGREQGGAQPGCHFLGKAESSVWAYTEPDVAEWCLSMWTEEHPEALAFQVAGYFYSEKLGWFLWVPCCSKGHTSVSDP